MVLWGADALPVSPASEKSLDPRGGRRFTARGTSGRLCPSQTGRDQPMFTIRATSVIGYALAIGFAASPARAGNPCVGDAKETFTDCKGDCKESYQADKDACLQRD